VANLSVLQGMILDMVAEGKSPRQIEAVTGVPAAQVHRIANELLDKELNLDTDSKRKLQVYRLEKIIEALWDRVQKHVDRDDVRNLVEVMDRVNDLLALHKERDAEELLRVTQYQSALYIASLKTLIADFRVLTDSGSAASMTDDQWDSWVAQRLELAQATLDANAGELDNTTPRQNQIEA
jgi:hypothetical protein